MVKMFLQNLRNFFCTQIKAGFSIEGLMTKETSYYNRIDPYTDIDDGLMEEKLEKP